MKRFFAAILVVLLFCLPATAMNTVERKTEANSSRATGGLSKPTDPQGFSSVLENLKNNLPSIRGKASATSSRQSQRSSKWIQSHRGLQIFERPDATVYSQLERGVVAVEPKKGGLGSSKIRAGEDPRECVLRYILENASTFGLDSPRTELRFERSNRDSRGITHLRFQQQHKGIPIWGRELNAHVDPMGKLTSVHCLLEPSPGGVSSEPKVSPEEALDIAEQAVEQKCGPSTLREEDFEFFGFGPPDAKLHYWQKNPRSAMSLVWVVEVRPNVQDWYRVFVNAETGQVLELYNATKFDGPATASASTLNNENVTVNTYQIDNYYYLIDSSRQMFVQGQSGDQLKNDPKGVVWTLDLRNQDLNEQASFYYVRSENNTWADTSAVSAHHYAGLVYDYFFNTHNRNSFDNQGKSMMALIRVARNGQPMDNAFWNGAFVSLGDGQQVTTSWAGALDFVAHEFTHAHVQYTANLEYKFQSGALNETFADIGGVSVDNDDFLLGEDIVVQQYFPSGAMRDMANPHNGGTGPNDYTWQPAHMNEYRDLTIDQDNGGVHINCGITNLAAYKILTRLGRTEGEKILFRALENYLNKQSNFTDFRVATVRAATDLHGEGSQEVGVVEQAFDEVGIVTGTATEPPEDIPAVSGQQFIVMINEIDPDWGWVDNSLFITNGFDSLDQITQVNRLTQTWANINSGRPLAVDPYGQEIIFVDSFLGLRSIQPSGANEFIVDNMFEWWSVAISPTGTRVACTLKDGGNSILLFDLVSEQIKELTLLHPTTDHDNEYADVVNYADTMVFLDDQLLVYDCYNSVNSPGGGKLDFWDVNMIDVDSGKIFALLPPQKPGVDVINPNFASTNRTVLCVEIYEEGVGNQIVGLNLSTGEGGTIVDNGLSLGFPDYSVDDQHIIFSRTDQQSGYSDVYVVPLGADKTSSGGDVSLLAREVRVPTWFAQGTPPSTSVGFAQASSSAREDAGTVNIPVSLTQAVGDQVSIDYSITGGNAIGGGVDYVLENGRVTIAAQQTGGNIPVQLVDDGAAEENETITLTLSRPLNAWMGEVTSHQLTIEDTGGAVETETPTPTATETPLMTPTVTPTATGTAFDTPTATSTASATPTGTVQPSPKPEDINGDGEVNHNDLFMLMKAWQD